MTNFRPTARPSPIHPPHFCMAIRLQAQTSKFLLCAFPINRPTDRLEPSNLDRANFYSRDACAGRPLQTMANCLRSAGRRRRLVAHTLAFLHGSPAFEVAGT